MYVTIWTAAGAIKVALPPNATIEDLKSVLVENLQYDPAQLEISYGGRYVRDDIAVARFPPETLVAEGPRYSQRDLARLRQQQAYARQRAELAEKHRLQQELLQQEQQREREAALRERQQRAAMQRKQQQPKPQPQPQPQQQPQQQPQRQQQRYSDPRDLLSALFGQQVLPPQQQKPTDKDDEEGAHAAPSDDDDDEDNAEDDAMAFDIFGNPLYAFGAPRPRTRATKEQIQQDQRDRQLQQVLEQQRLEKERQYKAKQELLAAERAEREANLKKLEAAREQLRNQQATIRHQQESLAAAERELLVRMEEEARKLKVREAEEAAARAAVAKAAAAAAKADALAKKKAYEAAAKREEEQTERRRRALEEAARAAAEAHVANPTEEEEEENDDVVHSNDDADGLRSPQQTADSFVPPITREQSAVIVTPHLNRVGLDEAFHRPQCEQPSPASSTCSTPRTTARKAHRAARRRASWKRKHSKGEKKEDEEAEHEEAQQQDEAPTKTAATAASSDDNATPVGNAASPGDATTTDKGPIISVKAHFPEMSKDVMISIGQDALVSDLINVLKTAEPEATKSGLRVMFCDKYVRTREDDTVRAIPVLDGSAIDVCTGKFLSENEMTLYIADRKLRSVQSEIEAQSDKGPVDHIQRTHWNERLLKCLLVFDSLQDVPEDIRLRRKAGVKAVMAAQEKIAAMA